jgi:hypothetical protein
LKDNIKVEFMSIVRPTYSHALIVSFFKSKLSYSHGAENIDNLLVSWVGTNWSPGKTDDIMCMSTTETFPVV